MSLSNRKMIDYSTFLKEILYSIDNIRLSLLLPSLPEYERLEPFLDLHGLRGAAALRRRTGAEPPSAAAAPMVFVSPLPAVHHPLSGTPGCWGKDDIEVI